MIWAGFVSDDYLGLTNVGLPSALILGGAAMITPALIAGLRRSRRDATRRTHELDVRRAAYQERLKIARDVHDLVGHSLSVINMQAGVALYLLDKDGNTVPAGEQRQVHESLQAIRSTSKSALDELRATLAVFRGEDGDQRGPVAGLDRLPEVIEAFRTAGRTVELLIDDQHEQLPQLPGPIDTAAYRIVQEALTNVARHTRGASALVSILVSDQELIIDVTDDGPPVQPRQHDGNGLIGMSERAEAVGGTVHTGPLPDHGFGVHAEFSIPARSTT
jgi:signal transduction histidine kinase